MKQHRTFSSGLLLASAFMAVGCAPSFYNVKEPAPSAQRYELAGQMTTVQTTIIDERRGQDKIFSSGILLAQLKVQGKPVDPPAFLAKEIGDELKSRGLPVSVVVGSDGSPKLHLKQFHLINHRASGFSPFFTFTYFMADMETTLGTKRIAAYVRRGKVPVWSFDEVIDPTFNQPLDIVVKEVSSKIAADLYNYKASDEVVNQLVEKISRSRSDNTYLDVYALGFTNNPSAIDTLVKLAHDSDEYIRQAAISSLGTIRAVDQFELLKGLYIAPSVTRQDRDMIIKAIGDLDTPDSRSFIKEEAEKASKMSDKDAIWTTRVLALYL